ncbi:hypothetical protein GO755_15230 [Spirosoma sp. HMF4905]|uniref:DUF4369 domain-containing protein n=1 Tax=Spirosoma arboris TaxID=2682092 RepID=A0A7K1SCX0_9BACT|nr:hypothetical protein [Spirosoma arboris]MVM31396.1 hypothetical protein [Spirosoma arboris]
MKALLIAISLLSSTACLAQYYPVGALTMWSEGYVVTLQNDTIQGQVRVGSLLNDSPVSVIVRTDDGNKVKLKGGDLQLIAQRLPDFAYSTGSIPREREMVIFERVPNPRRNEKPMLLERLTPFGGSVALYFDVAGWKKTTEYTFGNFTIETSRQDLSYIVLKNGREAQVAKRGEMEAVHERLFGDCPAFIRNYPSASRRNWNQFGEMVVAYNQLCSR